MGDMPIVVMLPAHFSEGYTEGVTRTNKSLGFTSATAVPSSLCCAMDSPLKQ